MEEQIEKEPLFEFYIAGVQHHQLKTCISEVEVGNCLNLILEPSNKYDPNAVRIELYSLKQDKDIMLGFVPMKFSASVSALMTIQDLFCVVVELNLDEKPWRQIKVAIEEI